MADEAKLHSPICPTFEALVVYCALRLCHWEELGPFCRQVLAVGIAVFSASHQLAEHISQMQWLRHDSESCSGSHQQQATKEWPWHFFGGCKFGFGKGLELLLSPTTEKVIAGHLNKFHFLSQVTIWLRNGLLLSGVSKEDTWKWWLFWFVVSSWITLLSSFFTFPICFKCQSTIEWSMLSSWATSRVVVRSLSMIFPGGCCQLPMASHCAHLQGSCLLCKTTWTTTTLYIS